MHAARPGSGRSFPLPVARLTARTLTRLHGRARLSRDSAAAEPRATRLVSVTVGCSWR